MTLTQEIRKKIIELVFASPRSIQEIALELDKNWRTIDNYVNKLKEEGLVSVKEFSKGSRTAFKIVYMQPEANQNMSNIQLKILKQIESSTRSQDFSPLNIIQYIPEEKFTAYFRSIKFSSDVSTEDLFQFLNKTNETLLMFSGDLSWLELKSKKRKMIDVIENLARDKVNIKIIARIDNSTKDRVVRLLNINYTLGRDAVEIRHEEHPLRCFLVDNNIARLKEPVFSSTSKGLKRTGTLFYQITDESWISWLERVFWSMFRTSIPVEKRLSILDKIDELKS